MFADSSAEGVPSHGLNRFPRFVRMVKLGNVVPAARPERISAAGAIERWNGNLAPGHVSATVCMERAMDLARAHGIGCVALANTNHWMRGGAYGKLAAEAGLIAICWTNTFANMPAWGSGGPTEPRVGNNPLVIAVPDGNGGTVLLDMAMAQFSFGQMENYRKRGEPLPFAGGYNEAGELTTDPAAITRTLPIGMWKGAGLSTMLNLMAALLSGGAATHELTPHPDYESGISQVFLAINPSALGSEQEQQRIIEGVLASVQGDGSRYPGQRLHALREESLRDGVPVPEDVWQSILALSRE